MKRLRILTLMARHGTEKYKDALSDLQGLLCQTLPDVDHEILIADNSIPLGDRLTDGGITVIGASNEAWEFSAWNSAIAHVGARLDDFDFIHLTTSAFNQLYVRYLERFSSRMLSLARGRAAAIGHIDYYGVSESLLGIACQAWLRSSYIFLPPAELRALGSLVSVSEQTHARLFFGGDPSAPFLPEAPVSLGYRSNVISWLTGGGTGQGTEWHSKFALTQETLSFFQRKVLAIFNEQLLSSRLRAQGCAIVDATWLATVAGRRGIAGPIVFSAWQEQVSSRDVDMGSAELRVGN